MMNCLSTIWEKLRQVQHELKHGSLETQDEATNDVQHFLDNSCTSLFPSNLYPQCVDVLKFYCISILPRLSMSDEDRQSVCRNFERTIYRLNTQETIAKALEAQFKQMFSQIRSGKIISVEHLVAAIHTIVVSQSGEITSSFNIQYDKELEKTYRTLVKKQPFTSSHALPFFQTLISRVLPEELQGQFEYAKALFWDQLHECVQMKAVLVNPITKDALIARLHIETSLEPSGLDELRFENTVDDKMYLSCWHALQAARRFLEEHFPDLLKNQSLHVTCCFQNPVMEYNDASASLSLGIRVIGDVLDMEIDLHALVSGEIDASGKIIPVANIPEKFEAAEQHDYIHQFYLPEDGLYAKNSCVTMVSVQTFADAVEKYYGAQLQRNISQSIRSQMLVKVPNFLGSIPMIVKDIFSHRIPVTEIDVSVLECTRDLYQKYYDYQKAIRILHSLLKKFESDNSTKEVLHLKAQIYEYLGWFWSYWNTAKHNEKLYPSYQAVNLWGAINDKEHQAAALFNVANLYENAVALHQNVQYGTISLNYYQQGNDILTPSMKNFNALKGKYYAWTGYLHYWLDEYEIAEKYCRKAFAYFEHVETDRESLLGKQHLGRVLVRRGKYDEASIILQDSAQAPALQNPVDRARNFWSLCDLFLSIGQYEKGLEYADQSAKIAIQAGAKNQYIVLQHILARHDISCSDLETFHQLGEHAQFSDLESSTAGSTETQT